MKSKQDQAIKQVLEQCVQCSICVKECTFLQQNGDPKELARQFQDNPDSKTPFSCSLCGLCTAVCPKEIDPAELFYQWRKSLVATQNLKFKAHNPLRNYEQLGGSKLLSWYGLPSRCDTIFFPGCALPGTRAKRVVDVIQELQTKTPSLGVLLDCCTKPSHDLGDHATFLKRFQRIQAFLDHNSIRTVLVACPNCYRMFKEYGRHIQVQTIYERLPPQTGNPPHDITIHDPCGVRFNPEIHQAVRTLLAKSNGHITEMKHHGTKTICCGEGGAVGFLNRELAKKWTIKRGDEALEQKVITYCAGCTHFLGQEMDASHILDFLFEPEKTMKGEEKIAKSPFTYYHRFRLKKTLNKLLHPTRQGSLCT
jgi:Fe-S oxidoreductase